MLSPNFVSIHNGFNFDLITIGCNAVCDPILETSIVERRLGNVRVKVFWKLTNGVRVVDTIYTADETSKSEWTSFRLEQMCKVFDLPSEAG
jgi:hypothetical protein